MKCLSAELPYGALLEYSHVDELIKGLKSDSTIRWEVGRKGNFERRRCREIAAAYCSIAARQVPWVGEFLHQGACLVPMPRSSPLQTGWLWPTQLLCQSLLECGLGQSIEAVVKRQTGVAKSAFCRTAAERPSQQAHYDSVRVEKKIIDCADLLLVDDVVTRGATLLGVFRRVREAYPDKTIRAFAVAYTVLGKPGPNRFNPHRGTVRLYMGAVQRD